MMSMVLMILFSISSLFASVLPEMHDFHVSRCEINYETASGDIQIAAHIFVDDLENALKLSGYQHCALGTSKENAQSNAIIEQYLQSKLKIETSNKKLKPILLGKELSDDQMALWCYLEVTGIKEVNSLKIDNTILMELFNDQKNIIDFRVNNKKKHFYIVDAKKSIVSLSW
ncbi:MAG: hypothetical protein LC107_08440 [Chitinophagales bacterium]|nr:hypothetical protein [Chitinophagales bacterium]